MASKVLRLQLPGRNLGYRPKTHKASKTLIKYFFHNRW
jgi:hypothetical protein